MRALAMAAALAALFATSGLAVASGSFRPDIELMPALDQVPAVRDFVLATLEMAESGSAGRIGNDANALLGGTRVGPYVIAARPKGSDGPFVLELVFRTTCRFLDASGAQVGLADAVSVEERFESLEIRPAPEAPPVPPTTP